MDASVFGSIELVRMFLFFITPLKVPPARACFLLLLLSNKTLNSRYVAFLTEDLLFSLILWIDHSVHSYNNIHIKASKISPDARVLRRCDCSQVQVLVSGLFLDEGPKVSWAVIDSNWIECLLGPSVSLIER